MNRREGRYEMNQNLFYLPVQRRVPQVVYIYMKSTKEERFGFPYT